MSVILELSDSDAENWRILKEAGVFNMANGSAEIHFNPQGQIASIDTHQKTFRRVHVVVPTFDRVHKEHIL